MMVMSTMTALGLAKNRFTVFVETRRILKEIKTNYTLSCAPLMPGNDIQTFERKNLTSYLDCEPSLEAEAYTLPSHISLSSVSLSMTPHWRYHSRYESCIVPLAAYFYRGNKLPYYRSLPKDSVHELLRILHSFPDRHNKAKPIDLKRLMKGELPRAHPDKLFAAGFYLDSEYDSFPECLFKTGTRYPRTSAFRMHKRSRRFSLFIDIEPFTWEIKRLYLKPRQSNSNLYLTLGSQWDAKKFRDITFDKEGRAFINYRDQYYGLHKT